MVTADTVEQIEKSRGFEVVVTLAVEKSKDDPRLNLVSASHLPG